MLANKTQIIDKILLKLFKAIVPLGLLVPDDDFREITDF